MPSITRELKEEITRAILDWAIRKHFSLGVKDPLPTPDEVNGDDVKTILAYAHSIKTIDDFLAMKHDF